MNDLQVIHLLLKYPDLTMAEAERLTTSRPDTPRNSPGRSARNGHTHPMGPRDDRKPLADLPGERRGQAVA